MNRGKGTAGWRTIGGKRCYFRSMWEANFARYLQFKKEKGLILDWEHESQTFWFEGIKRGTCSYKPDFKVIEAFRNQCRETFYEVKGHMDAKSATKIKRFRKYYPEKPLEVIGGAFFKRHKSLQSVIPGWEKKQTTLAMKPTRWFDYSKK